VTFNLIFVVQIDTCTVKNQKQFLYTILWFIFCNYFITWCEFENIFNTVALLDERGL